MREDGGMRIVGHEKTNIMDSDEGCLFAFYRLKSSTECQTI